MKKMYGVLCACVLMMVAGAGSARAHCQVPCGIYDDPLRFTLMEEHVTTIEKSMVSIDKLSKAGEKNYNQIVRWVANKDHHADELAEIITYYFMAQRVKKPADASDKAANEKYTKELVTLHEMLVEAMKAKQTTDESHIAALRKLIGEFRALYLGK